MKTSDCNLRKKFAWLAVFLLISYVIPWCLVLIKKLEYGTYGEALIYDDSSNDRSSYGGRGYKRT